MSNVTDQFTLVTGLVPRIQRIRSTIESGLANLQSPSSIQAKIQLELDAIKADIESVASESTVLAELGRLLASLNRVHVGSSDPRTLPGGESSHDTLASPVQALAPDPVPSRPEPGDPVSEFLDSGGSYAYTPITKKK